MFNTNDELLLYSTEISPKFLVSSEFRVNHTNSIEFLLEETEVFYAVFHIRKVRNVNFTVISEHIISC